jgi:hypothetical protein
MFSPPSILCVVPTAPTSRVDDIPTHTQTPLQKIKILFEKIGIWEGRRKKIAVDHGDQEREKS